MSRPITLEDIVYVVSKHFDIGERLLRSNNQSKAIKDARRVAAYLMTRITELPYKEIKKVLGRITHTFIIHSVRDVRFEMERSQDYEKMVLGLVGKIHVRAQEEDQSELTDLEALEDVIERLVQRYTKMQMEAEAREHEQDRDRSGQPGGHSQEAADDGPSRHAVGG
jgi:hypothetical protein